MSRRAGILALAALLLPLLLPLALGACGKRGVPIPPEGQESQYNYPGVYPAPSSVLPSGAEPVLAPAPVEKPSKLSPFPDVSRTKTKKY